MAHVRATTITYQITEPVAHKLDMTEYDITWHVPDDLSADDSQATFTNYPPSSICFGVKSRNFSLSSTVSSIPLGVKGICVMLPRTKLASIPVGCRLSDPEECASISNPLVSTCQLYVLQFQLTNNYQWISITKKGSRTKTVCLYSIFFPII